MLLIAAEMKRRILADDVGGPDRADTTTTRSGLPFRESQSRPQLSGRVRRVRWLPT